LPPLVPARGRLRGARLGDVRVSGTRAIQTNLSMEKHIKKTKDGKLNVAIIGPTEPYRGGIAHYNTELAAALRRHANVELFSFSRQYPHVLYPGKAPRINTDIFSPEIHYTLDSNNPLTWRKTVKQIAKRQPDVVLIHWWTLFWQPAFWYIARRLRKLGVPVIFIAHNLFDHDASSAKKRISGTLLKGADGYLVHSSKDAGQLAELIGESRPVVCRNLPSPTTFPQPTNEKIVGDRLEALFIGFIRPYKGLDLLVEAYSSLSDNERKRVHLAVVGEVWGDEEGLRNQLDALGIDHNLSFVSEQQMVDYVHACDVVVLPYRTASGSAVIPLAYHLNKPVIATRVGGIADVVLPDQTGWLVDPSSREIADLLGSITPQDCMELGNNLEAWVRDNNWESMAGAVVELIEATRA